MTSLKKHNDKSPITGKSILYLNRHQTEEWKGWMQVTDSIFSQYVTFTFSHVFAPASQNISEFLDITFRYFVCVATVFHANLPFLCLCRFYF